MTKGRPWLSWLILAGASIGIGLGTVEITNWLRLDPCHLCIFQRLLMLVFGTLALGVALTIKRRRLALMTGGLALCASIAGAGTAAYQSWIQLQPAGAVTCTGARPGLIELLVEWLGQQMPALFLATGFCEDEGFTFLGLSLANWSLVSFAALSVVTAYLLLKARPLDARLADNPRVTPSKFSEISQ
ncbi:disulfide bond formation protein B [Thiocystis violacea]|uniref:disulfide bond formation protein B n=1 Tax=Thiocystis violacea TaxID=13725 RepID=UPI001905D47C|nr:disulfide bond formation protein B [Thiocystis violacea]MBK1725160.1 hypothetical protein [Thiocystis violacea]